MIKANCNLDSIYDDFEERWKSGERPEIAGFLSRVDNSDRTELLRALIQIEVWWRRHETPAPSEAEYQARFPEENRFIVEAFDLFRQRWVAELRSKEYHEGQQSPHLEVEETLTFVQLPNAAQQSTVIQTGLRVEAEPLSVRNGAILGDRYEILEPLGRGGMGEVFLGRDRVLSRSVAVKFIRTERFSTGHDEIRERLASLFRSEAKFTAQLTHSGIANVYDFGVHEGHLFAVFEFVSGDTLSTLIRRRAPIPIEVALFLIGQLSEALNFAHAHGVIHRDLKPDNIIVTPSGQPKILDFGLAMHVFDARPECFSGTAAYAAPEQVQCLQCDGRTDQYALAFIVFELLTSQRPLGSRDVYELLRLQVEERPPHIQTIQSRIPEHVARAVT